MNYCKVTAIIRGEMLANVERRLVEVGACGMTVSKVKGCGEWMDFFQKDWMVTHARVEIFTAVELAETIAHTIMEEAHTGEAGDGIVAILPVQQLFRIRTKSPGISQDY